jgi:signal transduction histidine kinase
VITVEELRPLPLFAGLTDAQLGELVDAGTEVEFEPGDILFVEGEPASWWWVLVSGQVELVRHIGREETVLGAMDAPGRWAGGFRAWDEHGAYLATGRASSSGRVLQVPAAALRERSDAWFPFGGHLIQGLFRTARTFEAVTRQKEALVALGTLAAGLAHEINNPAAAAARTVEALSTRCATLLSSRRRLAEGSISAAQFATLDRLRQEIVPAGSSDPLDAADREEAVSAWLVAHGVEEAWTIAPTLAAAGVDVAWCDRVAGELTDDTLGAALTWVASTLSASTQLAVLRESTRRISALVHDVRTYSQLDRASVQRSDVREGLASTLSMLAHRIPDGVTVVRELDDVPSLEVVPGELNQVWTNLIGNALDAMGDQGTLRLTTRPDGAGGLVVEIADTGPGMSAETRAHAFEPFFTTKGVGKGTGLGLDISRRIVVDRHGGDITLESEPGVTVLRVHLPGSAPVR